MKISDWQKRASHLYPATLVLRSTWFSLVPTLTTISLVVTFLAGATLLFSLIVLRQLIPAPEVFNSFQYITLPIFTIFGALTMFGISLIAYINSKQHFGYSRLLPEIKDPSTHVTFSVADIILPEKISLGQALLKSNFGREFLLRAGAKTDFEQAIIDSANFAIDPNLEIEGPLNLESIALLINNTMPEFSQSLRTIGITPDNLINSGAWIDRRLQRRAIGKRKWGRDFLKNSKSLGTWFSYGMVNYLKKFGRDFTSLSIYRDLIPGSNRMEVNTSELEKVLLSTREANALITGSAEAVTLYPIARLVKKVNNHSSNKMLFNKKFFLLNTQSFGAVAGDKNSYENLLIKIMNEAVSIGNAVVVIGNLTDFLNNANRVGVNALAILSPYLSSSSLQLIAVDTPENYQRSLSTLPIIREKFNLLAFADPNENENIAICEEVAELIENRHGPLFTYPSLKNVVELSNRAIVTGIMPDRAIELMWEVATHVAHSGKGVVTPNMVEDVVENKTGIPLGQVSQKEQSDLLSLAERIHSHVIGQGSAIKAIVDAIKRTRAGIHNKNKPIGSFLFLGPTGVGKTAVTKALALEFFGNANAMSRFDMSEYSGTDGLRKLIGSFDETTPGLLSTSLREKPYSLLLLDEFEKASQGVHDLFLQILDEGNFSDGQGRKVNARNALVIATSNAGAQTIWDMSQKGLNLIDNKSILIDGIVTAGVLRPELINRFDDVIIFHPLEVEHLAKIASAMLKKTAERILENTGISVTFADDVAEYVATAGADPQFGARPLEHFITESIESHVADIIIKGTATAGDNITITRNMLV